MNPFWEKSDYSRRQFLSASAYGLTMMSIPGMNAFAEEMEDVQRNAFPASMLAASRQELDLELNVLAGRLPIDATGHAFVISSLPDGDGSPVVNGDGMIYRFDFGYGSSGLRMKSRIARTPCFYADQASQGTSMAFKNAGIVRRSQKLGTRNQANTAFVCHGDRMLVTFDGGRPFEIDTESLELATPVGRNDEWISAFPAFAENFVNPGPFKPYLSGAHPYWDEYTGELFLVNFQPAVPLISAKTYLLKWDGEGDMQRFEILVDGKETRIHQSMHQIAATSEHVILMDTAFRIELEQILSSDLSRHEAWDTAVYIIKRSDLQQGRSQVPARKLSIPREIAHFIADYDDSDGQIKLHLTHGCSWMASEWIRSNDRLAHNWRSVRQDLHGMMVIASDMTPIGRYHIDSESGEIREAKLLYRDPFTWSVNLYAHREMPNQIEHMYWTSLGFQPELLTKRVFDRNLLYKYRKVPIWDLPFATGRPASLFRVNTRSLDENDADGFVFPRGRAVSSPVFVPRDGSRDGKDGYILLTVMSDEPGASDRSGDEIWLFDASDLGKGPICRLGHPLLNLSYTLHTAWLPQIGRRQARYLVPIREDYGAFLAGGDDEVARLFEESVFPHFS
ncbi:MAG: carotenoid oxygenase family protein [Oligoflexus sp.]